MMITITLPDWVVWMLVAMFLVSSVIHLVQISLNRKHLKLLQEQRRILDRD